MSIDVFFATNRNKLPDLDGLVSFGDIRAPRAEGIALGAAQVDGVTTDDPSSGQITHSSVYNFGGIGPELGERMLKDQEKDIWVFVHGAANTFTASIQRAAYVSNIINTTPGGGRAVVPFVFSWPSRDYDLGNPAAVPTDYHNDQGQAAASAPDFVEFLRVLYRLKAGIGQRRLTLLAHSMGNYMLGFGLANWFASPRATGRLFDHVVLAAADEVSTTFATPEGGGLSDLWELTPGISIYSNREDVLMLASHIANGRWRLGYDGPPNRADRNFFATTQYEFIDCTGNEDFTQSFFQAPDRTHQYYRQSLSVRADVARTLKAVRAPDGARNYDASRNVFTIPVA